MNAVEKGEAKAVEMLIKSKYIANIDVQNSNGKTPVHLAADHGNFKLLRLLVEAKADVNICSNEGVPPLYSAGKRFHVLNPHLTLTTLL